MITTLLSTTKKALNEVYSPTSKLPKQLRDFPILSHIRLETCEGMLKIECPYYDEKTQKIEVLSESIPARIESELSAYVPAKPFKDWLSVSQLTKHEKAINTSEQMAMTVKSFQYNKEIRHVLEIKTGNTLTTFICLHIQQQVPF